MRVLSYNPGAKSSGGRRGASFLRDGRRRVTLGSQDFKWLCTTNDGENVVFKEPLVHHEPGISRHFAYEAFSRETLGLQNWIYHTYTYFRHYRYIIIIHRYSSPTLRSPKRADTVNFPAYTVEDGINPSQYIRPIIPEAFS